MNRYENPLNFSVIVKDAILKVNQYSGGNRLLFVRLEKSRSLITQWKNGVAVPDTATQLNFINTATSVIAELNKTKEETDRRCFIAISKLNDLLTV
ncbi:hypothetical protein [Dyadobacter sp. CY351]|uniref:hypothetical protein n=1 Tax=Dyadobacter sp. CY351 TaxID=2909337 RepID=UPI001F395373|nr:hypothetical protein [Dyadobacter sp. CY351]MCF2517151.1 hypothetical protein [Dyadobacter sp. CY351]